MTHLSLTQKAPLKQLYAFWQWPNQLSSLKHLCSTLRLNSVQIYGLLILTVHSDKSRNYLCKYCESQGENSPNLLEFAYSPVQSRGSLGCQIYAAVDYGKKGKTISALWCLSSLSLIGLVVYVNWAYQVWKSPQSDQKSKLCKIPPIFNQLLSCPNT